MECKFFISFAFICSRLSFTHSKKHLSDLPTGALSTQTVDELSQVKRDLEAALKDVLQAVKVSHEGASPDAGASLEALTNVSTCFLPLFCFLLTQYSC